MRAAGDPAVSGEHGEGLVGAAVRSESERHRHGAELGARLQQVPPAVVGVGGTEQGHVGRLVAVAALPAPASAVVLDLPQPGATRFTVGQAAHGEEPAAGPDAPAGHDPAIEGGRGVPQLLLLPAELGEPLVIRPHQVGGVQARRSVLGEAAGHQRADRLQLQRIRPFVAQDHLAAQHRQAVRGAVAHLGGEPGAGVVEFDAQRVPVAVTARAVGAVPQPRGEVGVDEVPALAPRRHLDQRQRCAGAPRADRLPGCPEVDESGGAVLVQGDLHGQGRVAPADRLRCAVRHWGTSSRVVPGARPRSRSQASWIPGVEP